MEIIITTTSDPKRVSYFLPLTHHAMSLSGCENPLVIRDATPLGRYDLSAERSSEDIFILADDDVIPCTDKALGDAISLMEKFDEIGVLGLSWKKGLQSSDMGNWFVRQYAHSDYPSDMLNIWEVDHVGGLRIFRRDAIFPNTTNIDSIRTLDYKKGIGDDMVICDIVRANGYKVCLTPDYWFHHIGEGFSTIWK